MIENGVFNFVTNGGERKMHYMFDGDKYYLLTPSKSNKVAQIKEDNKVSIDINDNEYIAHIYTDEKVAEVKDLFQANLKGFNKFMNRYIGKKNDAAIILELIKQEEN